MKNARARAGETIQGPARRRAIRDDSLGQDPRQDPRSANLQRQTRGNSMKSPTWERWGAVAGLLFPILSVGGGFIGGFPSDDNRTAFTEAFARLESRQHFQAAVSLLAVLLFVCFLGSLHARMRRSDGESTTLGSLVLGAGMGVAVLQAVAIVVQSSAVVSAHYGDSEATHGLLEISNQMTPPILIFFAVVQGCAALFALSTKTFPRWFGTASAVLAALSVLGAVAGFLAGLFFASPAVLLTAPWVVIASVLLLRPDRIGTLTRPA